MKTCQSNLRWLVLLRHAEAQKNIEDRHGGLGTTLTEEGRRQATEVALWLTNSGIDINIAWYSKQPQVIETVKILSAKNDLKYFSHKYLSPLNLGNLAGLSRDEAMGLFPLEAKQMEEWRKGNVEVQELQLPGGDDPLEFYERGLKFYQKVVCELNDSLLIVTSRSVMILMISILLGRTPTLGGGYVEIPMRPCDRFVFFYDGYKWNFEESMSSGRIK